MICASCGHESAAAFRFCPECGAPAVPAAPPREQRKVVTVLFCDVTGSTSLGERLDPEALRALLARYFERMKGIVESHGGTVEKFIGDAVMAVFGVPVLHEDDALRACRAAVEMRDALPELGVAGRIGVATGEVVAGTEERLATGDAVNVAARLEQAAAPGEVLVGAETLRLVRDAAQVEAVAPLALKGKAEPVAAYRLVRVAGAAERAHSAPMVGRERQQRLLAEAFASVRDDRACHLFTILGAAGVGKSRLAAEFLAGVDARVARGRCLSYGEGIAYWPVVEVLKQLGTVPEDERAAAAVDALLGEIETAAGAPEIAWAVRKTLEQAAEAGPLVVVWDDLHWADQTFLDLVEHVADLSRDAPILLLCMARPELLDRRPGWAGGKLNATTVLLEPLSSDEAEELIDRLGDVDPELRARIRDAAEGNPLFVEEMLALAAESGGDVVVPPSIQALLAARLDQLDRAEREVLERGAVEGKLFHRSAVEALSDGSVEVPTRLVSLVRKELLRPDRTQLPGDDAFRFRHLLIRDAAYDALPKAVRADLHLRFADWLGTHGSDLVERDEILGYHLEQAYRYRLELGDDDQAVAAAASEHLQAAARRAFRLQTPAVALALLERARELGAGGLELEVDRCAALYFTGHGQRAADEAARLAETAEDRTVRLCARIEAASYSLYFGAEEGLAALEDALEEAAPELEAGGDSLALYVLWNGRADRDHMRLAMDDKRVAAEHAFRHALERGSTHLALRQLPALGGARAHGSTTWTELLGWIDEQEREGLTHGSFAGNRALALASLGRADEAKALFHDLRAALHDRGALLLHAMLSTHLGMIVHDLADEPERAETLGREGCRALEQLGERGFLSTGCTMLAELLLERGAVDEAETWALRGADLGSADDVMTQAQALAVRARVHAHRGEAAPAARLGREAVALLAETQCSEARAMTLSALGDALAADAACAADAVTAYAQAAELLERKESLVRLGRVRTRLAQLGAAV